MLKSAATNIVARRLGVSKGRADGLVQVASDAGLLPKASGKRRPDLGPRELATLLIAIVCDRGLGIAAQSVKKFASLETERGDTLHGTLAGMLAHGPALMGAATGSMVVRLDPASVSLTLGGQHRRFGPEPPPDAAGKHTLVPGATLCAIGLELQGRRPDEADSLVALARVSRSLSLAAAFEGAPT